MANLRYLILTCLFLSVQFDICCQKILDPEYNPPDVWWNMFLTKGGEASQETICLLIDSKGFLWSGTENGLYRFDGIRYIDYGVSRGDNNGFTGYTVTNIFEDSQGTIWIGTSEALNRLNQKTGTFLHYVPDSTDKSPTGNFIRAIREDSDGLLWIITRKHIFSFDRGSELFTKYPVDSLSWTPQDVFYYVENECFIEDDSRNKWFVTYKGLYKYNYQIKNFGKVILDEDNSFNNDDIKVNCITRDENDNIWIGTAGSGLIHWNNAREKPERIEIGDSEEKNESFNSVSSILADKNGSVWTFGNSTFANYNPENKSVKKYIFLYKHRSVYESPGSDVWIDFSYQSSDGTIWFFNRMAGLMFRLNPLSEKLSLYRTPNFVVYQCIMDKTESFWFASIRNNISRLVTNNIPYVSVLVTNTARVDPIHKRNIFEDENGKVWFMFNLGIKVCNNFDISSSLKLTQFRFPDGDTTAITGFKDREGNLWFSYENGKITKFDPRKMICQDLTPKYAPYRPAMTHLPIFQEDSTGNLWIATAVNGIYRFNKNRGKFEHILDQEKYSDEDTQGILIDFLIDSQGDFWILTGRSLLRINVPENRIVNYTNYGKGIFKALGSNIRVAEDTKENILVLNSRSGLYLFSRQDNSFKKINIIYEETDAYYYDLLIDRDDKVWIAHNSGITIFDQQLKEIRTIKTPKLQYDIQSYQIKTGEILYLNENQLYIFNKDIPVNNYVPPVYITSLFVNGKNYNEIFPEGGEISSLRTIELPFKYNTLSFEFAALNFLNPEQNKYRYFMAKSDKDTITVSSGNAADYKSIPSGRYKFWVTGSNNDGQWNKEGVSLEIRIHPPWFRSVIAYIIYVIAFISLLAGYIRFRTYRLRRDKTRLKAEIEEATAELEIKNRKLAEIDRIKTHFFTDISHEIRTPLSLILGPLENISKEEMLSSRMSVMIDLMKSNAQRLMHLVNQLLDISRLDAGKMKITLIEDDIVKCLRILVYEFLSMAESKQISYIADLPEKSFKTWFDRDKTEKIISNLLTNAFKYTPRKGVVQCVVKIENDKNENSSPLLKVRVLDSGPGISKEHHDRIFDRFYRIEGHHESDGHGTGIGLSLVQEFVSLLHGKIDVESTQGKGSDFSITLPLGKDHLPAEEYVITQFSEGIPDKKITDTVRQQYNSGSVIKEENGKLRILIIEDNEDLRKYIKESLYKDYIILEAENGSAGRNAAFTMMPDLIVTDIMMPDLDGISLCRQIKNDERTSHIPVILLTAKAASDDKIAGLQSGADDYIIKPFNMDELGTRISNLLAIREKLRLKYDRIHIMDSGKWIPESVDDKFMERILKIVNSNLRDHNFDVGWLQEHIGMSKTHLTRKLKILTGLSPGTLIRNIRLEKAAELLKNNKGNITEIANIVGVSNPSNFTKSFRKYFGVSPKEYSKHKNTIHPQVSNEWS